MTGASERGAPNQEGHCSGYDMARLSSERAVVQKPLVRYATEAGWTYADPEEALRLRRGESSPIFWETFIQRVQVLNPGVVDHLKAEDLAKRLTRVATGH